MVGWVEDDEVKTGEVEAPASRATSCDLPGLYLVFTCTFYHARAIPQYPPFCTRYTTNVLLPTPTSCCAVAVSSNSHAVLPTPALPAPPRKPSQLILRSSTPIRPSVRDLHKTSLYHQHRTHPNAFSKPSSIGLTSGQVSSH